MAFPRVYKPRKAKNWKVYSYGCADSRFRDVTRRMVREAFEVLPAEVASCFDFGGAAVFSFEKPNVVKALLAKISLAVDHGAKDVIVTAHTLGCKYLMAHNQTFLHQDKKEFDYTMGLVAKAVATIETKVGRRARVWGAVLVKHPTQRGVYFEWLGNRHP